MENLQVMCDGYGTTIWIGVLPASLNNRDDRRTGLTRIGYGQSL